MSTPLPPWPKRPREVANLLNPAFTSLVLARAVAGCEATIQDGLPLPMAFLVLPIVLHPETRNALPRAATTTMYGWLAENPDLKALFPVRARAFVPFTREALRFAVVHGKLAIARATVSTGDKRYAASATPAAPTAEVSACLLKAAFLGRWFAATGSPANILATWGVRP